MIFNFYKYHTRELMIGLILVIIMIPVGLYIIGNLLFNPLPLIGGLVVGLIIALIHEVNK